MKSYLSAYSIISDRTDYNNIKRAASVDNIIMTYKVNRQLYLEKGDCILVSNGPYFTSSAGEKIRMGHFGKGTFIEEAPDGNGIYVKFQKKNALMYVYMGEEKMSEETKTMMRPHKIKKINNK